MKLGRYEVVRELGKGAMGIVYLAKDPLIGRLVALKTIRPAAHYDDDETKEFQQRFVREAQAAGILNHPSIVTVFDIGQDETSKINFIAMEYVEGQNLKEVLSQGRALSFDQIAELVAQVAEALDFAHSKGIVHRDVKPANVILLEGNRSKIMDFGIAKIASGGGNLTTTGQFLGTPNYMAPEQIKGQPVDGRTDIFSLGICLYECLTRRKPFGGDSLTSISYKIVHEPFPPLHEINPQIPDGFEDVVAMCLAKEPGRRYQRGRELALALRAVIRGERPRRPEPMLNDATVLTADHDRLPTLEMPFPDAADGRPGPAQAARVERGAPSPPRTSRSRVVANLHQTLTNVRAHPTLGRQVPVPLAVGIIFVLVAALLTAVVGIRNRQVSVPEIDVAAAERRARERELRIEGNDLLRQGRVRDAYDRFEELSRLAPNSPAVNVLLQKISAMRTQEEIGRAQIILARQKLAEGIALLNARQIPQAVMVLQTSYALNPNDPESERYLKLAQQEQARLETQRLTREQQQAGAQTGTAGTTRGPARGSVAAVQQSQLTTSFDHPFNDGYIIVEVGADRVVHEELSEVTGRFIRRRNPRPINVSRTLTPKNADVKIWIVVRGEGISQHHTFAHNFRPGSSHSLQITYNQQNKSFGYQMN
ncbi:MAG TPA: serine/threonine-protein kinase [Thermoanaerobaculia bacterium]|nr:serine/threonine-protein kinase [Thermoanaerobaculia bacterium]